MPEVEKQRSAEKEAEIDRRIQEIRQKNALIEERFRIVSEEAKKSGIPKASGGGSQNGGHQGRKPGSNGGRNRVQLTSEKLSQKLNDNSGHQHQKPSRGHGKGQTELKGKDSQWSREWDRGKTNVEEWKMNVPELGDHGNTYFKVGENGNWRSGRATRPRRNPGYYHDNRFNVANNVSQEQEDKQESGSGNPSKRGGRRGGGHKGGKQTESLANDTNNTTNVQSTDKDKPSGAVNNEKTPKPIRRQNQKHKNPQPHDQAGVPTDGATKTKKPEVIKQPAKQQPKTLNAKNEKQQNGQKESLRDLKPANNKHKNAMNKKYNNRQNNKKNQAKDNAGPLKSGHFYGLDRVERSIKTLLDNIIDKVVMQEKKDRRKENSEALPITVESAASKVEDALKPETQPEAPIVRDIPNPKEQQKTLNVNKSSDTEEKIEAVPAESTLKSEELKNLGENAGEASQKSHHSKSPEIADNQKLANTDESLKVNEAEPPKVDSFEQNKPAEESEFPPKEGTPAKSATNAEQSSDPVVESLESAPVPEPTPI